MANIRQLTEDNNQVFYPQTHEKAVIDSNGVTLDGKIAGKQDNIADLSTIRSGAAAGATAYQKPSAGIPSSDMTSAVQNSLELAVGSLQKTAQTLTSAEKAQVRNNLGIKEGVSKVVSTLPTTEIDENIVYLVPTANAGEFTEYKYNGSSWENLGTFIVPAPTVVNDLETGGSTSALSAEMGVVLDGKISQLGQKVTEVIGVEEFTFSFPAGCVAYTLRSVSFAFKNGERYKISIAYPSDVSLQTFFSLRGKDATPTYAAQLSLGDTSRTFDLICDSHTGQAKTLCLSIAEVPANDVTFAVRLEVVSATSLNSLQEDVNSISTEIVELSQLSNERYNKIAGAIAGNVVFPNGSVVYTIKSIPFNFVNGAKYKLSVKYPEGSEIETKFSIRGETDTEVIVDNLGVGSGSRSIEWTCNSNNGKKLCLSILENVSSDITFEISAESLNQDDLSSLSKEVGSLMPIKQVVPELNSEVSELNSEVFGKENYTLLQGAYASTAKLKLVEISTAVSTTVFNTNVSVIMNSGYYLRSIMYIDAEENVLLADSSSTKAITSYISEKVGTKIDGTLCSGVAFSFHLLNDGGNISPSDDIIKSIKRVDNILDNIGELPQLVTDDKNSLVGAINELAGTSGSVDAARVELFQRVINRYADFRMLIFTDPHDFDKRKYDIYQCIYNDGYVDCVLGLGDIQPYINMPIDDCVHGIAKMMAVAGKTKNHLYGVGNHDVGVTLDWEQNAPGTGPISPEHITTKRNQFDFFARHLQDTIHNNPLDPYNVYYYKDFEYAKVRVIMLNSSDIYDNDELLYRYTENVAYHQAQVDWLVNSALDLSAKGADISNWHIIVCTHTFNRYPFVRDILVAAHNGETINRTTTVYNRMKYNSTNQNYDADPQHTEGGITLSVNKTFSMPLKIIVFKGHDHFDLLNNYDGLKELEFYCDNDKLFHPYITEVNSLPVGKYFFTTMLSHRYGFEITELYTDVATVCYNAYFAQSEHCEVSIMDSDGCVLEKWNALELANDADLSNYTELTGFEDAIHNEADKHFFSVVSLNKETNTITTTPFSFGANREISI